MDRERKKIYKKIFQYIVYGYLIKNYSKEFIRDTKHHLVIGSMTNKKCVAVIVRSCGNYFNLDINLKKKTIQHIGVYQANREYPNDVLIQSALDKFKDELCLIQ